MKKTNKFQRIFTTAAVFATLATTSVTATVHADDSSSVSGITTDQMKQYGIEHGYISADNNADNVPNNLPASKKTNIDEKSKKMGYIATKEVDSAYPNAIRIEQFGPTLTSLTTVYEINGNNANYPNIYTRDQRLLFIDGITISQTNYKNQSSKTISIINSLSRTRNPNLYTVEKFNTLFYSYSHQNAKYRPWSTSTYTNKAKLFKIWLHADYNKMFTTKQPSNWKTAYLKQDRNVMQKGYKESYMLNKIDWASSHPAAASKQLKKLAKRVILKDQRTSSDKNDFDSITTIEK